MSNFIKELVHVPEEPLRIEREFVDGREIIVIEGVRYEADYFRTFSHPETDVLYSVEKDAEGVVKLTIIRNRLEAARFFDETFGADPAFTWKQVKERYIPPAAYGQFPEAEEIGFEEEDQGEKNDEL